MMNNLNKYSKTAADFFAGIGLVELGLRKAGWDVVYSLDHSNEKQEMHKYHFGKSLYAVKDINEVDIINLPKFNLAHASFPCTDTSIAGARKGLNSGESAAFWGFIDTLKQLNELKPNLLLIENVEGFLNSQNGDDLRSALIEINKLGYSTDIFIIDAIHFVPQSRKRLFIIGSQNLGRQDVLRQEQILFYESGQRSKSTVEFIKKNPEINWHLRPLAEFPIPKIKLADIISDDNNWWPKDRAEYFFSQMSDKHKEIALRMIEGENYSYGTAFRRMRINKGEKKSMAELRTDGIAGCLRTPKGGSAKQILFRAGKGSYNVRLINKIEAARLMGAEEYKFNPRLTLDKVLFALGDAVVVPVITWLAENYLNPLLAEQAAKKQRRFNANLALQNIEK